MISARVLGPGLAIVLLTIAGGVRADPLPPDSLYQLQVPLRTQADEAATLDAYRGHPVLISMFYTSCGYVCPMLVRRLQHMDQALAEAARADLRVMLVSFDPERDTPQALAEAAQKHKVDPRRWMLARAEPGDVRKLAAALGIQYRKLPGGMFNHATIITLLDADGRMVAQTRDPSQPDPDFIARLERLASTAR